MRKMLVTGASGFLGSRIKNYFKNEYEILSPSHKELDITNNSAITSYFEQFNPNIVINTAAISQVAQCEKEPELSHKINVNGAIYLAAASRNRAAKYIFCSSDQIYFSENMKSAHTENEHVSPLNRYGNDKLTAERECLKVNPSSVCLRLSWMYDKITVSKGEHGSFFTTLTDAIENNKPLFYPIHDIRGITDVNEILENLKIMLNADGGVYNFGSYNDMSTYDMMQKVFLSIGDFGVKLYKNEDAFKDNPRNISMVCDKVNSLGVSFNNTFDGIVSSLRDYKTI